MKGIVHPGASILFMKIGCHAKEPLDEIVKRKLKEIEDEGYAMWGYGGNTCHPTSMVQPFAEESAKAGQPIILCMQEMNSNHFADQVRAKEFSSDGITWKPVPSGINPMGSRFALTIKDLKKQELTLPLAQTRIAVGPSRGRLGSRYILNQVDKACLQVMAEKEKVNDASEDKEVKITWVAELQAPYAVFLRNDR
jgi:hypothetical protein